jgi:hypothetical protein
MDPKFEGRGFGAQLIIVVQAKDTIQLKNWLGCRPSTDFGLECPSCAGKLGKSDKGRIGKGTA